VEVEAEVTIIEVEIEDLEEIIGEEGSD